MFGPSKYSRNNTLSPWLVWLSGLSAGLRTKGSVVWFPVRAHAWVAGRVPGSGCVRGNQSMCLSHIKVSLPRFLPPFPFLWKWINKIFIKKRSNKLSRQKLDTTQMPINKRIGKLWCIHTMGTTQQWKGKRLLTYTTTWMNLRIKLLSEQKLDQKSIFSTWFH